LIRKVREEMTVEAGAPKDQTELNKVDDSVAPDDDAAATEPSDHRQRVIEVLQSLAPSAFERFCQRLLREAGFQNVEVTGRAGDGGIDGTGILQVNSLVSFKVLFQCKRYRGNAVTPSQVRDFRGAMGGRADKGIILTTGGFTQEAKKEAVRDGVPPIELVDGEKLVTMLEELEMGLVPVRAFRVDEQFFATFATVVGETGR
jgi:restriction system protein